MNREERQQRIEELERWIAEQNAEFQDDAFPDDVRQMWQDNNRELEEHRRVMAELAERDRLIERLARRESNTEPGGGEPNPTVRRNGPQLASRMNEGEVYELSTVVTSPLNPEVGAQQLRDRAMRAVELAHFPAQMQRERAQAHVANLLDSHDSQDKEIARRILLTGSPAYKRAFVKTISSMLRGNPAVSLAPDEQRAMEQVRALTVGIGSQGGFAVPFTLDPTVVPTSNLNVNPFRALARVIQITGNEWRGVTSDGVSASYRAEAAEATDATQGGNLLAQPTVTVESADVFVPASFELTQDWGALQSELSGMIQDAKDDLEAIKFTNGSGTGEPEGLLTGATTTVTAGGSGSFVRGDLYKLEDALGARFRPRAAMVGNRAIWNLVRDMETTGGGGAIWNQLSMGLANVPSGNMNAQVLGYPANEDSQMASDLASGNKILVLGDFRYYVVVDRVGMDIEVIPHLFGANQRPTGQRGFYAYWRNSAKVLSANAFRVLRTG